MKELPAGNCSRTDEVQKSMRRHHDAMRAGMIIWEDVGYSKICDDMDILSYQVPKILEALKCNNNLCIDKKMLCFDFQLLETS